MSDPRFRPLSEVARPVDLMLAVNALLAAAQAGRVVADRTTIEERRIALLNGSAAIERMAEWLEHQATACAG
jgi:hypothetical protein